MTKKMKRKTHPKIIEQGKRNLEKHRQLVIAGKKPGMATKHGVGSQHFRKRFSDKRTVEGKWLQSIVGEITNDLGGETRLTTDQRLILGTLQTKLQVLYLVGRYVDEQDDIFNKEGDDLIRVLQRSFLQYSKEVRQDLEALYRHCDRNPAPNLQEYLAANYGGKKK